MFGAAGAVGLIGGLAQWLGTSGLIGGTGDRTVIIAGGAADSASQTSLQVMNRFLNRLPTITIREGHRMKVYLTTDIQLPAYQAERIRRDMAAKGLDVVAYCQELVAMRYEQLVREGGGTAAPGASGSKASSGGPGGRGSRNS